MTEPTSRTGSPTTHIVLRGTGLGLVSGGAAGALLGWPLAQFHPIGLAFGAVAGLAYGVVGGLAVGLAVARAVRAGRSDLKTHAAVAATVPSVVALAILLSSTMDAGEWIPFLVVIPAAVGAMLAARQADLIAGVPLADRISASQRSLPPGPLAGPWDTDA